MENFINGKFYLVQRILSIENLMKYSVEYFIQHSDFEDFYPVCRLVSFYLVQRLFYSAQTFIQCVTIIQCRDFYPVGRLLSSVQTFIQCVDFYLVQRLLSSVETFIQCVDFYPVQRLLSSVETFIQCRYFYPVQKLFS